MMSLTNAQREWMAIALAAVMTFGLRAGGLLLGSKLPESGASKRFLEALPGTLVVALIAPGILENGPLGILAIGAAVLLTLKTKQVLLGMVVGVAMVALGRYLGWGGIV